VCGKFNEFRCCRRRRRCAGVVSPLFPPRAESWCWYFTSRGFVVRASYLRVWPSCARIGRSRGEVIRDVYAIVSAARRGMKSSRITGKYKRDMGALGPFLPRTSASLSRYLKRSYAKLHILFYPRIHRSSHSPLLVLEMPSRISRADSFESCIRELTAEIHLIVHMATYCCYVSDGFAVYLQIRYARD